MAGGRRRGDEQTRIIPISDCEHPMARRANNPPVGLAHLGRDETPVRVLSYDPHLDPQLVWAGKGPRYFRGASDRTVRPTACTSLSS